MSALNDPQSDIAVRQIKDQLEAELVDQFDVPPWHARTAVTRERPKVVTAGRATALTTVKALKRIGGSIARGT